MITDILPYVESYANIRLALGVDEMEVTDEQLQSSVLAYRLSEALNDESGVYPSDYGTEETLQQIYDRLYSTAPDEMTMQISLYSVYVVADEVAKSLGLLAQKTTSDGKSTATRFSPESTYLGTQRNIKRSLETALNKIRYYLGKSVDLTIPQLRSVKPAVDLVTGE